MKVVILAGGFGTRLAEYTEVIPKPMVKVGGKPILWHIMRRYAKFGHTEFLLALGYKAELIKDYFLNYTVLNSDFTVNLLDGEVEAIQNNKVDWKVSLIDTGLATMTGGRVKQLEKFIGDEAFMLAYGDGLANIDLKKLLDFHNSHGKMVTMTVVRPSARFGEVELEGSLVKKFEEKPQMHNGWINGGFFVIEPNFLNLIAGDSTFLEREPLESAVELGELMAFMHDGFWQCMDTKRDLDLLESLSKSSPPWER
jgi:glucose-1-phosphate cytidylyltransferase